MTETLSTALRRLAERGFSRSLRAEDGRLRDVASGQRYEPERLSVAEVVRFEGQTDPDEEATLFALHGPGGQPFGTWTVVFGPSTPPEDARVLRRLGEKP